MKHHILRFVFAEDAATAVEYAVILGLILLALLASVASVGDALKANVFDSSSKLGAAMGGS